MGLILRILYPSYSKLSFLCFAGVILLRRSGWNRIYFVSLDLDLISWLQTRLNNKLPRLLFPKVYRVMDML